jgi:hypothetical protein
MAMKQVGRLTYSLLHVSVLVLLLSEHLLLVSVELDGFLVQFVDSFHRTPHVTFKDRTKGENMVTLLNLAFSGRLTKFQGQGNQDHPPREPCRTLG